MLIAVVQNAAGADVSTNLNRLDLLLAPLEGVDLVVLPEVFALRGDPEDYRLAAEPVGGSLTEWLARRARALNAWLLGGSVIERGEDGNFYNTSILLDRAGSVRATYRKIHLFEATLDDGSVIREEEIYTAGSQPVLVEIEGWRCGLSICYDLRFPELYRWHSARGADLLLVPSNFTQSTGKAHWETLLRARAIENQCYVVGANQCGENPMTHVASYGHSRIIDPWGETLAETEAEEGILSAPISRHRLREVRNRVPALRHRRLL